TTEIYTLSLHDALPIWSACMSAAQRIFEIQDAVPDIIEKDDAVKLDHLDGDIKISNVSFSYEPNKTILKNVSLVAKPGQMIGVVGPSGAGKSTLDRKSVV